MDRIVRDDISTENCSVGRTLELIGERWTMLILREAFFGVRRFDRIQANLGIARNILTDRLNKLVAGGVLERRLYQERPERFEYRLTNQGRDLYPALISIMRWGDKYLADESGPSVTLVHKGCGHPTQPVLACEHCGKELTARDVEPHPGPGALPARAA